MHLANDHTARAHLLYSRLLVSMLPSSTWTLSSCGARMDLQEWSFSHHQHKIAFCVSFLNSNIMNTVLQLTKVVLQHEIEDVCCVSFIWQKEVLEGTLPDWPVLKDTVKSREPDPGS